ncbi:MAG: DUF3039 domain-containing protein [Catenulispora sp.]|nr:DUF3039 domain-containing protein [Catenulispora sp.]
MSTPTFEPDPVGSTIVEERVESEYRYDPGDEERFAHYAERDKIMEASVFGTPLTALCGKVWVPSRDPSRFPVCPECKEIFEGLDRGDDGDSGDGGTN